MDIAIININGEFFSGPYSRDLSETVDIKKYLVGLYKVHQLSKRDLRQLTHTINRCIGLAEENPNILIVLLRRFVSSDIAAKIVSDIITKEY